MGEMDELRRRLEALEAQVHEVMEQQATTRHLAVSSDRDVAALQEQRRADIQLIRALRETQLGQGKTLEAHTRTLEAHTKTLTEHSKLLGALVTGQVAMMEQLQTITDHLGITPPERPQEG
ncbi:hypothetical protein [Streptomyces cavernae]|uniref:hypothetical protein n=1 Tax=Streptomyces cavernae TaxID=2259034 RepID=UPI000FEBCAED|nr:hypothetical protein [Streptomyces cavernae]